MINTLIKGVESERCPSWQTRRLLGKHTKCLWSQFGAKNSIADGLAVAEVGSNAFATCDHLLDKVISISEDWVSHSICKKIINSHILDCSGNPSIIRKRKSSNRGRRCSWCSCYHCQCPS